MIKKTAEFNNLKFVIAFPDGYEPTSKYPTLFFLHGAGTRGNSTEPLENHPFFLTAEGSDDFPFIAIAPLCSKNTWFDIFEELQKFVLYCISFDFVDTKRFYLMGASMGGYATWQLAMTLPDCFAAIVPICGGGMYWNASRLINTPVWAFHGEKDCTVLPEESKKMVSSINNLGGHALLTIYPDNGHDAWSDTFKNEEVYRWLLSKTNNNAKSLVDNYHGSISFG